VDGGLRDLLEAHDGLGQLGLHGPPVDHLLGEISGSESSILKFLESQLVAREQPVTGEFQAGGTPPCFRDTDGPLIAAEFVGHLHLVQLGDDGTGLRGRDVGGKDALGLLACPDPKTPQCQQHCHGNG